MKKYIKPEVEIIEVELENVVAASPDVPGFDPNGSTSSTRSKKRFWGDEEE